MSVYDILVGGKSKPPRCLSAVLRHAIAVVIHRAELVLRFCLSLLGGSEIPTRRFGVALRHALAAVIQQAEVVLRFREALVGGLAVPARRFGKVLHHAAKAACMRYTKSPLRLRDALVGGQVKQSDGLGVVPRQALTRGIQNTQPELRCSETLLCGAAIPVRRLGAILEDSETGLVHRTDHGLRPGLASDSQRHEFAKGRVVVAPLVCSGALVKSRRRGSRQQQEEEGGGQEQPPPEALQGADAGSRPMSVHGRLAKTVF